MTTGHDRAESSVTFAGIRNYLMAEYGCCWVKQSFGLSKTGVRRRLCAVGLNDCGEGLLPAALQSLKPCVYAAKFGLRPTSVATQLACSNRNQCWIG